MYRRAQLFASVFLIGAVLLFVAGCAQKTASLSSETEMAAATGSASAPTKEKPAAAEKVETADAGTAATESAAAEKPSAGKTPTPKPSEVSKRVEQKAPSSSAPSLLAPGGARAKKRSGETSKPDDEVVLLVTTKGQIVIELYPQDAPLHVANFKKLVKNRFYEGAGRVFHRHVPGFVIQGGDPKHDGTGGPGYTIPAEIKRKHVKGAVAAARLPDNVNPKKESNGSQFYIALKDLPQLDGEYTVFGQVIHGMDVVERLRKEDMITKAELRPRADYAK